MTLLCSNLEVFITASLALGKCCNQHIVITNTLAEFSFQAVYSTWAVPENSWNSCNQHIIVGTARYNIHDFPALIVKKIVCFPNEYSHF